VGRAGPIGARRIGLGARSRSARAACVPRGARSTWSPGLGDVSMGPSAYLMYIYPDLTHNPIFELVFVLKVFKVLYFLIPKYLSL
jgi:hypothetical protein